jgi:hypothetical protein
MDAAYRGAGSSYLFDDLPNDGQRVALDAASLEAQHQREMMCVSAPSARSCTPAPHRCGRSGGLASRRRSRIHEAWQQTKNELAGVRADLGRAQAAASPGQRDAAMQQLQALTVELRDKGRFTELQLAGAREECVKLSTVAEELPARLGEAQQQTAELQRVGHQQSPMILELQATVQRLTRERQEAYDRLHEEQRTFETLSATRDQTGQLHEQKVHALNEELRRALDKQRQAAAAIEEANRRAVELERTNGELGRQLLSSKEQLKYLHLARRSEAQVNALLHQLQLDNARLVKLLASTDEYKVGQARRSNLTTAGHTSPSLTRRRSNLSAAGPTSPSLTSPAPFDPPLSGVCRLRGGLGRPHLRAAGQRRRQRRPALAAAASRTRRARVGA